MYGLYSGNRDVTGGEQIPTKTEAIGAASTIVQGNCLPSRLRTPTARPPRSLRVVGLKGSAKNAKPVEVVALGPRRQRVAVREVH